MKRLFNAVFVALLSVVFIFLSGFLLQNQSSFYEISEIICTAWNQTDTETIQRFCVLIRHLITLTPLIWVYYLSVLLPRCGGWNNSSLVGSLVAMVVGSFLALLSVSSVYYAIFSKICYWEIDVHRSRMPIFVLNLAAIVIALFLAYQKIYAPSIRANDERWVVPKVFLRSCTRYISILLLGHFVLLFAVALRSFLFEARFVNMTDFLSVVQIDSRYWTGGLMLLVVEPLMQEIAFRGLIFEHMKKTLGAVFAAPISSFLYLVWYWNTGLEIYAFLLGLLFCYMANKGGRLRYAIFLHMLINALRMNFFGNGDQFFFRPVAWILATEKSWLMYAQSSSALMLMFSAVSIGFLIWLFGRVPAE